jgi:hypothetical protein
VTFDLPSAVDNLPSWGGTVIVPDEGAVLTRSVRMRDGVSIRGEARASVVVDVAVPNIDAFICEKPVDSDPELVLENLTIRTSQPGVTGFRTVNCRSNVLKDLTFKGVAFTARITCGIHHTLSGIRVKPHPGRPIGTLLIDAPPGQYVQHLTIRDYQTHGPAALPPLILRRATNVTASDLHLYAPQTDGILVEDDCQGLTFSACEIVAPNNGIVFQARNGTRPQLVDLMAFRVDQAQGVGVSLGGVTDVRIVGGAFTSCFQGIIIGPYPSCERVEISTKVFHSRANAIVALSGARYFSVVQTTCSGNPNGAGLVISPGDSSDITVALNDFSQGNATGFADLSGGQRKVIWGNR